jgi:hypothetical protein
MAGLKHELVAAARFATDGTTNGAGFFARGCSVVRNGAGDYTVTIDNGPLVGEVDSGEASIHVTPGTAGITPRVVHTSDSAKQILTINAAAAATDSICEVSIWRVKSALGG